MIIFPSPIPYDAFFSQEEDVLEECSIPQGIAMVSTCGGRRQIKRVISTDPAAYLNQKYSPGEYI